MSADERVTIFTDGSCLGNPGPGGWCALLRLGDKTRELSGGMAATTNNRMELRAVIEALSALKRRCAVDLYTDSTYIKDAVTKNWLQGWRKNGWKTAAKKPVKNQDLWRALIPLLAAHEVAFHWVRGHAGHPENERCDLLARTQAAKPGLPPDIPEAERC
ncbi:MAG: ribonuclease HI [Desulfovibrio aminophilus]|jgi:ribonuclease HI|uniref:ribonuclease HI n=1 Tax=Desulfovibrio aminophilus TaxID=81425 RepID=UPI002A406908|nr:ribonuclease HI [Desulfovibrionaceae bacterium]